LGGRQCRCIRLWSLAIRHVILSGTLGICHGLDWIPTERRARWGEKIAEALVPGAHPRDFQQGNGWVVRAFQAALSAVGGGTSLRDVLERAVRGGGDTDTVAAIAGSLAGAVHGGSAVPASFVRSLHGWPGLRADDLTRLAVLAARHGEPPSTTSGREAGEADRIGAMEAGPDREHG
jgi:hypothetical protein